MTMVWDILYSLLFLFSVFSACHAVLNKRDPRSGFGWVVTCLVFIGIGPCLYWIFGINRIRSHAQRLFRLGHWKHGTRTEREKWPFRLPPDHPFRHQDYAGLLRVSERVNRHPLMVGNRLEALQDGEGAYPAMLQAIRGAEKFVYLCSYIFDRDRTGIQFVEALEEAKGRGVQVRVLVDAFGERYSPRPIGGLLRERGLPYAPFLPLGLSLNGLHFNLRNHRKLLVVDGRVGFTGGMNIRDRHWTQDPGTREPVSDLHFRVEGPLVLELQEVFLEDWYFASKESLPWLAHPHDLLPGDSVGRTVTGGPNEDFEKIHCMLLGALAWAKGKVRIMTPYFVPDRILISALNMAALRGVEVEVVLPESNNLPFVAWAGRALLWEMLEKGVRFYYQPGPFSHTKLFVVDQAYALVGSSNWDSRSLRLNFELDLEVYDPVFAGRMGDFFDRVLRNSREVTLAQVRSDILPVRFRDSFFKLFQPYL